MIRRGGHYAEMLEEGFAPTPERSSEATTVAPGHYEIWWWKHITACRWPSIHTGVTWNRAPASQDTPYARAPVRPSTYVRYTWGKLEILRLRERARKEWGSAFSLPRFHRALLDLGSPPIGLIGTAIDRG